MLEATENGAQISPAGLAALMVQGSKWRARQHAIDFTKLIVTEGTRAFRTAASFGNGAENCGNCGSTHFTGCVAESDLVQGGKLTSSARGLAKIIDFGSTRISGIADDPPYTANEILGTAQYTAPEYFLGEGASSSSDIFSLGVIAYQMLTGRLPFGAEVAKARTKAQQRRLKYRPAADESSDIPAWVDGALRRAVDPDPAKRYAELSEFMFDLRHPNERLLSASRAPLMQRNPLLFWQGLCALLAIVILALLLAHTIR